MAKRWYKAVSYPLIIMILSVAVLGVAGFPRHSDGEQAQADPSEIMSNSLSQDPYFYEVKKQWEKEQIPAGTKEISINLKSIANQSPDASIQIGSYQGENDVLLWSKPRGWIEYEVDVAQEGLYEMAAEYFPFTEEDGGSKQPVMMTVQLNGKFPYREAHSISLEREFVDQKPEKFDADGNQLRSLLNEITGWKSKVIRDSQNAYATPLLWHLQKGKNTIRISVLRQPMALKSIRLQAPSTLPSYEEVSKAYPSRATTTQNIIALDAENFTTKNSSSIQTQYDRSPLTTPKSLDLVSFNTIGGSVWYKGGQAVSWDFDVPEDGLYKIAFRVKQNFRKNLSAFRTISIDGQIPFKELANYPFAYHSDWYGATLEQEENKPFTFYLTKGKHAIKLEAGYEPYVPMLVLIDQMSAEIRDISQEIRIATGNSEDEYRVWDVARDIPGITDRLQRLKQQFEALTVQMDQINQETNSVSQTFRTSVQDLKDLLDQPNEIPYSQLTIGSLQEKLESQRSQLMDSQLQIDKLYIAPLEAELPRMEAGFFENVGGMFASLYYSFTADNQISKQNDQELNVWMFKGRDYVDELQQLADEKFTPESGIRVKVNLIQSPDLLVLGKAAGILPDVAIGVTNTSIFDLALRHAVLDLNTMPGADKLVSSFHPGAMLPYRYDGGVYGIPETTNFKVLFYRKDILKQLGLTVPNTWDDVYAMLPTLLQNESNFYVDPADFSYLFFQNGVELYKQDGLSTALGEPQAFEAFKKWTDLFNVYGLERQVASFYNQFRDGTLPIGIADFNQYMQLLVAAPEILNEWGIAPIPGTKQADGTIARWSGGSGITPTASVLFNDTPTEKQTLAWKFLEWYMSDEIQTEYGLNLEQYRGEAFRWNSANVNAFVNMPWKTEDLQAILEQWKWIKDIPNVPGGYITLRELGFAWNRVTIDGENVRISLEKGIKEINRELKRKQQEFNFIDSDGNIIKKLDLPTVTEPWKGAEVHVD